MDTTSMPTPIPKWLRLTLTDEDDRPLKLSEEERDLFKAEAQERGIILHDCHCDGLEPECPDCEGMGFLDPWSIDE